MKTRSAAELAADESREQDRAAEHPNQLGYVQRQGSRG